MKKRNKLNISFITLTIILVIFIIGIIIANLFMQKPDEWKATIVGLLNDLLSVSIVGVMATVFSKIISENFFEIKKNNDTLLSYGVNNIIGGRFKHKDTIALFGNKKNYPEVIKLLFITGRVFFKDFKDSIIDCLQNSNCVIRILLMSVEEDNKAYIERCETMCPQGDSYAYQLENDTLPILIEELCVKFPNRIEIRYFKDEYRYNLRIAQYRNKDGSYDSTCWWNIQPFNKIALDLSIGLIGNWNDSAEKLDENVFCQLNKGFDFLWDKYEPIQETYNKDSLYQAIVNLIEDLKENGKNDKNKKTIENLSIKYGVKKITLYKRMYNLINQKKNDEDDFIALKKRNQELEEEVKRLKTTTVLSVKRK